MIHFGKALETAARAIRPFALPSYRRAFKELAARGLSQHRPGEPIVCCDFADPRIDSVGGRYYFSFVRDLIDAGYFPVFTQHRNTLSTFGTSHMKSLLLKERMGTVPNLEVLREPYLLITDREIAAPALAGRMVFVDYEKRMRRSADEISFPVFVHPQVAAKCALPFDYGVEAPRAARLFFGGNTEEGKYDKDLIRDEYHMLTRRDMLGAVAEVAVTYKPTDAIAWLASDEFHPYVLCETQHCKIPQERWLEALAKADFFLACPGVGMPLCHNLVEAMATGTIPVLQYHRYLDPPLENNVNCLSFGSADELKALVARILAMSPAELLSLRSGVRDYYNRHHAPAAFAKKLTSGEGNKRVLLLNAYRVVR